MIALSKIKALITEANEAASDLRRARAALEE